MNRRQKQIITNFVTVILFTTLAVAAMVHLKDWVNRSEAERAVRQLADAIGQYRQKKGAVPPESYIENLKKTLEGRARIGSFNYRARWIEADQCDEEILAYVEQVYHTGIFKKNVLVLRLDGTIEWMEQKTFDEMLGSQQTEMEKMEAAVEETL